MISNCGHDERGKYSGGQAGDQTGQEWAVIPWYSRPWNVVLRYPNQNVAQKIANLARAAANNDNIGYDQNQRYDYWNALRRADYDPTKISDGYREAESREHLRLYRKSSEHSEKCRLSGADRFKISHVSRLFASGRHPSV